MLQSMTRTQANTTVPATLPEKVEALFRREGLPGLSAGIVSDQELVWSAGYGAVDQATGNVPSASTLYRVASVTKTFTAGAILQLRDAGRLSLDDPLHVHRPEFGQTRGPRDMLEQVTLRRMLSHHAGLTTEAPLPCWDALVFPTRDALRDVLPRLEVVIPPATAFKYSNLAFGLLGEVVTRTAGVPFEEYLRSEILAPLGMNSSGLRMSPQKQPRLAVGYSPLPGGSFEHAPHVQLEGLAACGQLYSSVEDLARWIALQFRTATEDRKPVLVGATIDEMHRPQFLEPDWSVGYCLGWRATRTGNHVYHGHGGGIPGFASYILFSKPYRLGVILLSNVWPHPGLLNAATEIAEFLIESGWPVHAEPDSAAQAPQGAERLVGLYEARPRIYVAVTLRDGRLCLEKTSLSDYLLHAPAILDPAGAEDEYIVRNGRGASERVCFTETPEGLAFELGGFVYRSRAWPVGTPESGTSR